jgi:hypothetical protein
MGDHDVRLIHDERDRSEIAQRIVRELRVERRIEREADVPEQERVTVGADFATISVPITLPAPPRLSMTNVWRNACDRLSASTRAAMSVPPPAANGTTRRTGRVG